MKRFLFKESTGTSLVVSWLRIHLPVQGCRFDPPVRSTSRAMGLRSPRVTAKDPTAAAKISRATAKTQRGQTN